MRGAQQELNTSMERVHKLGDKLVRTEKRVSSVMSRVASPPSKAIFLHNVDWETYVGLSSLFDEHPGTRLTYDCGRLEIMAALTFEHENDSHFLGRVVEVLTEELELPIRPGKSTTLRRQLVKRGLEPDECFWIASDDFAALGLFLSGVRDDDSTLDLLLLFCSFDEDTVIKGLKLHLKTSMVLNVITEH